MATGAPFVRDSTRDRPNEIPNIIIEDLVENEKIPSNKVAELKLQNNVNESPDKALLAIMGFSELGEQSFRKRSHSDYVSNFRTSSCSPLRAAVKRDLDVQPDKNIASENRLQYITKRRKRSMTVTEIDRKAKNASDGAPEIQSIYKLKLKSKVPNFEDIHRQQFQKMESIGDYLQRKSERALNILSSAKKTQIVSHEKVPQSQNKKDTMCKTPKTEIKAKACSRNDFESSLLKRTYKENVKLPRFLSTVSSKETEKPTKILKQKAPNSASVRPLHGPDISQGVRTNRTFELQKIFRKKHLN